MTHLFTILPHTTLFGTAWQGLAGFRAGIVCGILGYLDSVFGFVV